METQLEHYVGSTSQETEAGSLLEVCAVVFQRRGQSDSPPTTLHCWRQP